MNILRALTELLNSLIRQGEVAATLHDYGRAMAFTEQATGVEKAIVVVRGFVGPDGETIEP